MVNTNKYTTVNASPVKRFFVEMLTRDIQVEDAILDLLDNCVDGIQRSKITKDNPEKPYEGFYAKISFSKDGFEIHDNCGGIPWSEHERAFRMGRPSEKPADEGALNIVGVYGIGMKRAIFKLGSSAYIQTQNGQDSYQVVFDTSWINDPDNWNLEVEEEEQLDVDGTIILVQDLHPDILERFEEAHFSTDLIKKIASHYAIIIEKGFRVEVNGKPVVGNPITFKYAKSNNGVRPYIFTTVEDGVKVLLTVGLREPIPGIDVLTDESESPRYSSDNAGWTIICNDRVVLSRDRSELTGWGVLGVPRYHTQFIAISGVVEFIGDPAKLPTTTTKRGLKFESSLYQRILTKQMTAGLKRFTDFTNKWKTMEDKIGAIIQETDILTYSELREQILSADSASQRPTQETVSGDMVLTETRAGSFPGKRFEPNLPKPEDNRTEVRISYLESNERVYALAEELLQDYDTIPKKDIPRRIGVETFDRIYKQIFPD
jgi:hypothetical protein